MQIRLVSTVLSLCFALVLSTNNSPAQVIEKHNVDSKTAQQAKAVAERIDQILLGRLEKTKYKPAPRASNQEFLRRLHLDLAGQIPTMTKMIDYLDKEYPRDRVIDELLASERYAVHFSRVWRSIMLPNKLDLQTIGQYKSFEAWLKGELKANRRYDQIARDIIMGRNSSATGQSPSAFYTLNGNKPEDLAGAASRVLLGVRLECAQCHSHPFAEWTREQFWQMAAFFQTKQAPNGRFGPGHINIPGTKKYVYATFLDGTKSPQNTGTPGRTQLANWIASKQNAWFAKAAADHLWTYFFGRSLLAPIRTKDKDTVKHPELLDMLAKEFAAHDFDLKFLIRAIVYSKAYQRTSRAEKEDNKELEYFARMSVRALNAEQLFDSIMTATRMRTPRRGQSEYSQPSNPFGGPATDPRTVFLLKFTSPEVPTERRTSILQALYMMNGKLIADRLRDRKRDLLHVLATSEVDDSRRIQSLYLWVFSRHPRADETRRLLPRLRRAKTTEQRIEALGNIYWALLNSSEFMLNH